MHAYTRALRGLHHFCCAGYQNAVPMIVSLFCLYLAIVVCSLMSTIAATVPYVQLLVPVSTGFSAVALMSSVLLAIALPFCYWRFAA